MLFSLLRPAIHALDPERAHRLSIEALKLMPLPDLSVSDPALEVNLAGIAFPSRRGGGL